MSIHPGRPAPLGASRDGEGVNFALYSEHAERVELVLFDSPDDAGPSRTVALPERTGPVWHGRVPDAWPGQLYGYRVHGPYDPGRGHRFNPHKVLLDPYARALGRAPQWHDDLFGYRIGDPQEDLSFSEDDSVSHAPLGAVLDDDFDWRGDARPSIPWEETVIYETHVRGLTRQHPEVEERVRGTYLGLASEPVLDHLVRLGVTTVELLPVQAFVRDRSLVEKGLTNYWGYNPLAYFAPDPGYATQATRAVHEFKEMTRALHARGLEVIIDVVYNHTGEGSHLGPTLSFRGIDNASYYKLAEDPRYYMDYTGTGNTLDPANPFVLQLITDSLRYWVQELHVDGFRFDLAAALAREFYDVNMLSAFFKVIQQDPVLSRMKLIAEPWDVGEGGYQVGNFPAQWTEWNGKYRDTVRRFWRGDEGTLSEFATRAAGSSDLYARSGRRPWASINFVTAHDGFTLRDLVSYQRKHNEANQEDNRDGADDNHSVNCGAEGPSDDPKVEACRDTLQRSLLLTLLLSQGVPMLQGGDELSRSQQGNNNAYCQDNPVSWYPWELEPRAQHLLDFVRSAVAFRRAHPVFRRRTFLTGIPDDEGRRDTVWLRPEGREMQEKDWQNPRLRALAVLLDGSRIPDLDREGRRIEDDSFLVLFNTRARARRFVLPAPPEGGCWESAFSTSPEDLSGPRRHDPRSVLEVAARSVMVLRAVTG
ncbi:MAG TPA: glycogen debranching protein GlgX [Gemmatimonadales bacterium]|nr:glycogen debranching protein GlgX [Gemmatimonadales bacterium]